MSTSTEEGAREPFVFRSDVLRHEWFWGVVSRSEVNAWMDGCEEGTFVVRQSTSDPQCYTLTVRKDGFGRMFNLHKMDDGGVYVDLSSRDMPNEIYPSLGAFVEHYKKNRLTTIDCRLNTTLTQPLVRPKIKAGDVHSALFDIALSIAITHIQLMRYKKVQNWLYELSTTMEKGIENRTSALQHYNVAYDWFQSSLQRFEKSVTHEAIDDDELRVMAQSQIDLLTRRSDTLLSKMSTIESVKAEQQEHVKRVQSMIMRLKPRVMLASHYTAKHVWVMRHQYETDPAHDCGRLTNAVHQIIHQLSMINREAEKRGSHNWTIDALHELHEDGYNGRWPTIMPNDHDIDVDVALPDEIAHALHMGHMATVMQFARDIVKECERRDRIVSEQQIPIVNQVVLRNLVAIDEKFDRLYGTLDIQEEITPRPPRRTTSHGSEPVIVGQTISHIVDIDDDYDDGGRGGLAGDSHDDSDDDDAWPDELFYFPKLTTSEAITRLTGAPDGTFLVRNSSSKAPWLAVSLVNNGKINHCLIKKDADGLLSFYFSEEDKGMPLFKTLNDFVTFYRDNSLKTHNPQLDTALSLPIGTFEA